MLRHPEKHANIKALAAHFHLIEEKGVENGDRDAADDDYDIMAACCLLILIFF